MEEITKGLTPLVKDAQSIGSLTDTIETEQLGKLEKAPSTKANCNSHEGVGPLANFYPVVPIEASDFNVENMRFDPNVDGNDPELLAELAGLSIDSHDKVESDKNLGNFYQEEQRPELMVSIDQASVKKQGSKIEDSAPVVSIKPPSTPAMNQRLLMRRILSQAKECKLAAQTALNMGDRKLATEFLSKSKAFETDLHRISKENLIENDNDITKVRVNIPVDFVNREMEENMLLAEFSNLTCKSGTKLNLKGQYHLTGILEWPPEDARHHRQSTINFDLDNFKSNDPLTIKWPEVRRDLRCGKFFEHHKLQIELVQVEKSFFGRIKTITVGMAAFRLAPICSANQLEERIELLDSKRKAIGISVTIKLSVQSPLSTKVPLSRSRQVEWMVLIKGESGKCFGLQQTKKSIDFNNRTPNLIEDIASYVVMEEEINQLKKVIEANTNPNPDLLARLFALENKLEQLITAVDSGQLEIQQYLQRVRTAIQLAKQNALYYKRANELEEARRWLKYVYIMEQEIAEAEGAALE